MINYLKTQCAKPHTRHKTESSKTSKHLGAQNYRISFFSLNVITFFSSEPETHLPKSYRHLFVLNKYEICLEQTQATQASGLVQEPEFLCLSGCGQFPHAGSPAYICLLYTSPSPRDKRQSRMPSSA